MPPAHKCCMRGMFLPNDSSYQDIWQKPLLLTLAYTQALQYWAEEANPPAPSEPHPLVMSVTELRWHVGKYTTFSEHDVFKDLGNAIPEAEDRDTGTPPADSTTSPTMTDIGDMWLSPMETQLADDTTSPSPGYQSEAKIEDRGTPPVDSTTSPAMADTKVTQPSPVETPLADYTTVPLAKPNTETDKDLLTAQAASPAKLENQVVPTARLVDKLASPPTQAGCMVKARQEYPQWIKVHSSQKAAAVGGAPYKSGEPGWHYNCSSRWHKRVQCLLEEEWQGIEDVSMSASSRGSLELAPQDEEGEDADLEEYPLGSWEVAECLTARGTLWGPAFMDVPEASMVPIPVMEPAIAMVISTSMGRDQGMYSVCLLTVTALIEIMNLEVPQWW